MKNEHEADWDPASEEVRQDQQAAYDKMRRRCPVAHSDFFGWSLFRHKDVMQALMDHQTFSNAVSQHLSIPNGMDPPEHTLYRQLIEPYFSPARMRVFEPKCREIARHVMPAKGGEIEFMGEVALPYAVRVQCAFLGWPEALHDTLIDWIGRNQRATLAQDRPALADLAREFQLIIDGLLEARRNSDPTQDITAELMHEEVSGRTLSSEEVASILRNWTAGEIGTISAAAGIMVRFLADDQALQGKLRSEPGLLPYSIDEILRIRGPLVANRRVTTSAVEIGGTKLAAGERVSLNWVSANRDEEVFEDAGSFRFGRDPRKNLLYGEGIHVCPGAPLASLELRVFMEEFLRTNKEFFVPDTRQGAFAIYPGSGFAILPLRID